MKVIRNTPDQLILSDRPWISGIAASFAAFAVLAGWSFSPGASFEDPVKSLKELAVILLICAVLVLPTVRRLQIVLDRTTDTFTIRRRTMLGHEERVLPLSDFRTAEMRSSETQNGKSFRPFLHFVHSGGTSSIPLSAFAGRPPKRMHDAFDLLNAWNQAGHAETGQS
jgi:hypothetical protein